MTFTKVLCPSSYLLIPYLFKELGPVTAVDVSQVTSVFNLVVSDFLVFKPNDKVSKFCFVCNETSHIKSLVALEILGGFLTCKHYVNRPQEK